MAILKVLIPVFVLAVLVVSFYWAIDPQESKNQETDARVRDDAITILDATSNYEAKFGKFPWEGQKLPWVEAESIVSKLVEAEFLSSGQVKEPKGIYLARGDKGQDKTWACFLPISKHERVDTGRLKSLIVGTSMPARPAGGPEGGEPDECLNSPDWQESFCYICVSK